MEHIDKIHTRIRRNDLPTPIATDTNRKIIDRKTGDTLSSVKAEDILTKGYPTLATDVKKKKFDLPYTEMDNGNPETLLPMSTSTSTITKITTQIQSLIQ